MCAFRQGNVQAAAGGRRAVQLRSEGMFVACGDNFPGERDVPVLPGGLRYVQAAAGEEHIVLVRSDIVISTSSIIAIRGLSVCSV